MVQTDWDLKDPSSATLTLTQVLIQMAQSVLGDAVRACPGETRELVDKMNELDFASDALGSVNLSASSSMSHIPESPSSSLSVFRGGGQTRGRSCSPFSDPVPRIHHPGGLGRMGGGAVSPVSAASNPASAFGSQTSTIFDDSMGSTAFEGLANGGSTPSLSDSLPPAREPPPP